MLNRIISTTWQYWKPFNYEQIKLLMLNDFIWNHLIVREQRLMMAEQKQDNQLEHTYSSSVRIGDIALKTYQRRWTIGRSGERGSGISVLAARRDDDGDDLCTVIWYQVFLSFRKNCQNWIPFILGAAEYTDCISAEAQDSPTSVLDKTLNNLIVRLQWRWSFIDIAFWPGVVVPDRWDLARNKHSRSKWTWEYWQRNGTIYTPDLQNSSLTTRCRTQVFKCGVYCSSAEDRAF